MDNKNILISDQHRVGGGFSVQFRFNLDYMQMGEKIEPFTCEWFPVFPSQRDLRRKLDLDKYRAARDQFIEEVALHLGGTVACIET